MNTKRLARKRVLALSSLIIADSVFNRALNHIMGG
jgi:hypothetical protein